MTRPRGVRCRKPSWSRYGSYTSSIVSGSSPSVTASVESPTGPPPNFAEHGLEELAVGALEAELVHLEELERLARDAEA